jgi:predicted methyltransferase
MNLIQRSLGGIVGVLALTLAAAAVGAEPAAIYRDAVAAKERSAADRERDQRDHPAEVLAFAGFKPGMRVADVFGGGGYNAELISHVVGPKGEVVVVNNPGYAKFAAKGIAERLKDNRLPNVKHHVAEADDLKLGKDTFDGAICVMSYHDLYWVDEKNGWSKIDAGKFLDQIAAALKPGAALVIVDHSAKEGTGSTAAQDLHRIDEAFAKKDITAHGLVYEASLDVLRNPEDDRTKGVFDKSIQGKTDRFVHRYRKPAAK